MALEIADQVFTVPVTLTLICHRCSKQFTARRRSAKYCSDTCRVNAYRTGEAEQAPPKKINRLKDKVKKLARSAYGRWLVQSLKRAGTVQVLQGAKVDDLEQLAELKSACNRANAYKSNAFEISHKYPVDGARGIGRLLPHNLVISPIGYNRRRGNTTPQTDNERYFLAYEDIQRRFCVDSATTPEATMLKLQKLLGPTFNTWLKSYSIQPTKRELLVREIRSQSPSLKLPRDIAFDELENVAASMGISLYKSKASIAESQWVTLDELERAQKTESTVYKVLNHWKESLLGPELPPLPTGFWEFVVEQAMCLLHGVAPVEEFEGKGLLEYLSIEKSSWCSDVPDIDDVVL